MRTTLLMISVVTTPFRLLSIRPPSHCGSRAQKRQPGTTLAPLLRTRRLTTLQAGKQTDGLPGIAEYVNGLYPEPEILQQLRQETAAAWPKAAQMLVSVRQGQLLSWLVGLIQAHRALEIGTFTGYSALALAKALPEDGQLTVCERDERPLALAQRFWQKAGVEHKITAHIQPAADTLHALLQEGAAGSYDFAFIDADKRQYAGYYESCLKLVRVGGLIALDNVLWHGRVADSQDTTPRTLAMRALNELIASDNRVQAVTLPVGDGVAVCRRLH